MADIFGSLAPDVLDPLLRPPRNPARMSQGVEDIAAGMTTEPIADAIKALRGQMTPTEAQNFAMTAAMGLFAPMARGVKPVAQGIRAYHGSPHDFDRFDISKIGTGEGAQSYGHGLYFAENPEVARSYKQSLTSAVDQPHQWLAEALDVSKGDKTIAKQWLESQHVELSKYGGFGGQQQARDIREALVMMGRDQIAKPLGRMYEVNINAKPEQFLDWDKPLAKQAPDVRGVIGGMGVPLSFEHPSLAKPNATGEWSPVVQDTTGAEAYRRLGFQTKDQASAALREAGIPGIKYLDQGSRKTILPEDISAQRKIVSELDEKLKNNPSLGDPRFNQFATYSKLMRDKLAEMETPKTSNYVLFNDKLVDILRKYGIAGAAGPAAASATFGSLAPDENP